MKVAMTWTGQYLAPLDEQDMSVLRNAYGPGELIEIDVKKARNVEHHRKFFKLFRDAVSAGCVIHGHRFHNVDALRAYVMICIGWCDYYDVGPVRMPIPRTINFDAVDQTQFTDIYNNSVLFMADEMEEPTQDIVVVADDLIAHGMERGEIRA